MGGTTAVAHGGNPQDRAASPRPRCLPKTALPPQDRAASLFAHPTSLFVKSVEWASWWNGHLGGMGILVEWASWWNGHLGGMGILVEWASWWN
ncbi:MAG: hypothetical protein F6K37_37795, partial [Moorea sp. SIO4E2]|nr:hypothetical protein [Moorena sp. SIO4E2]